MSHAFIPVQWNAQKKGYDLLVLLAIVLFIAVFMAVGLAVSAADPVILAMRALGLCAFTLLHIILMIGPAARLSDRFKPWLYNRRHLGVMTASLGLMHAALVLAWYHGSGVIDPLTSAIGGYGDYGVAIEFPFEILGLIALFILLLMAATSHDFWLSWLSPPIWKTMHMSVYAAYALLIGHIALGTAQFDKSQGLLWALAVGAALITTLHLASLLKARSQSDLSDTEANGWIAVGDPHTIPLNRARTVTPPNGERIAIFRHETGLSAIMAVCSHQNGPLGEGCIRDGLITCPWHGFQFHPETGEAPAPFEDKVQTHSLKFAQGQLWVRAEPNPLGTPETALPLPLLKAAS